MSDTHHDSPQHTQARRRLKYGLNVTVAIVAAVALAVLVNWLAFRHMPRWDMTGTGRYTLAEQTQQVLGQMDDEHEIVTFFRVRNTQLERVRDLVDEYERLGRHVTTAHIDPDRDIAARDRFYRRLHDRFGDELEPAAAAIESGRERLVEAMTELPTMLPELRAVAEHPQLENAELRQTVQALVSSVGRFDTQLETVNETLDAALDSALPDYAEALSVIEATLDELDQRMLAIAIERFDRAVDQAGVPNEVKEALLVMIEQMRAVRGVAERGLAALEDVEIPDRYAQLRRELGEREAVVVMGPRQVRVIPAHELQRQVDAHLAQAEGEPELQFLGEERITGALVSMTMDVSPMVVFVSLGQEPAIGPQGQYNQVGERLRSANFEIEQWTPAGGAPQMQQMQMPGAPGGDQDTEPPEPAPGQPVVWVVLPAQGGGDPMAAAMAGDETEERVVDHLRRRLAEGDGVLTMLSIEGAGPPGMPGPMQRWLETWGIEPDLDRVLLRERGPRERAQPDIQHEVTRWPTGVAVTEALRGMRGVFVQASPMALNPPDEASVTLQPLAQLRGDRLWPEPVDNLRSREALRAVRYDPDAGDEPFTVAVAAEGEENGQRRRLVAVTDGAWASDQITSAGMIGGQIAPGLAEMFGAAFPANSELFVNSVYWLAGLDEMIAASPRTQDIRRISAVSDAQMRAYQIVLLLGLPAAVLALGMGVWFVRRRG